MHDLTHDLNENKENSLDSEFKSPPAENAQPKLNQIYQAFRGNLRPDELDPNFKMDHGALAQAVRKASKYKGVKTLAVILLAAVENRKMQNQLKTVN